MVVQKEGKEEDCSLKTTIAKVPYEAEHQMKTTN